MRTPYRATQLSGIANLALMARVRKGFVSGFESITFARRLELLFQAINGSRQAGRESLRVPSPFQDNIGRWGLVQAFRYALYGPDDEPEAAAEPDAPHRVYLNVTFDGGWEPYLRVIYRDLGSMLDAIFCNCEGYPLARTSPYAAYEDWVRAHEIDGGMWYTDSPLSTGDQRYLAQVEKIQRESADPAAADLAIARLALPDAQRAAQEALQRTLADPLAALEQAFRSLSGLYALRPLYPDSGTDGAVLRRFARDALTDLRLLIDRQLFQGLLLQLATQAKTPEQAAGLQAAHAAALKLQATHRLELAWLDVNPDAALAAPAARAADDDWPRQQVQAGVINPGPMATHGALVLLRVTDRRLAAAALSDVRLLAPHSDADTQAAARPSQVWRTLALSAAGLQALGLPDAVWQQFPQEFADGMEARAGLLGDVRGNHPDHWQRPRAWKAEAAPPLDLATVHAALILRTHDDATASHDLHRRLQRVIDGIRPAKHGLAVMSVQPLRSWPRKGEPTRGHFGFADGLSQPVPVARKTAPAAAPWSDEVALGEVLLGRPGERDPAPAALHPLLVDGSFLVLRKLRQHVGRLNDVMGRQAGRLAATPAEQAVLDRELREQLMGRRMDGSAMVPPADAARPNGFDYSKDAEGQLCPFHSHVRRSNPRRPPAAVPRGDTPKPGGPRLMRRGMSYGPPTTGRETAADDAGTDRGLVFMAVVASIAEQFEVVQRWIAGGNASGVLQQPGDPFLGVPTPGEARVLRLLQPDGKTVRRVDLGDQPLVSLQWGLYLFLPTLAALQMLRDGVPDMRRQTPPPADPPRPVEADDFERWQRRLEDPARRDAAWAEVRNAGGRLDTAYGTLHGSAAAVKAALADSGRQQSVCGYGHRMQQSLGLGYLGQDTHSHDSAVRPFADAVNGLIEKVDIPQAYANTRTEAQAVLAACRAQASATLPPGRVLEVPLRLDDLGQAVLAALCSRWFGLPDAECRFMRPGPRIDSAAPGGPVHCPGHLLTVSRWVFSPAPSDVVRDQGQAQGQALLQAVKAALDAGPLTPLSEAIRQAAVAWCAKDPKAGVAAADLAARTLAGTLLGFAPTVLGNFINVMKGWIDTRELWALQQQWLPQAPGATGTSAATALQAALMQRMRLDPVPAQLWRLPPGQRANPAAAAPALRQVLGIVSALQDPQADPMLMFGGARHAKPPVPHACPGYPMAIGVLLGLLTCLLEAGELRPGASSTQLLWRPA